MTNIELAEKAKWIAKKLETVYVTGGQGHVLDASERYRFLQKNIAESQKSAITKAASDAFAFDCNGLIKSILWGFSGNTDAYMGGAKYKAAEDIPEDTWITKCNPQTDFTDIPVGAFVWMKGHCGIYVGDGYCVESTPKWLGGVQFSVCDNHPERAAGHHRKWTKWGKLPNVEYQEEEMTQEQFNKMADAWKAAKDKEAVSSWAKPYVEKAKDKGIMDGTAPQGFVTREQAAKMIITATEK